MAELADAIDSGSIARTGVEVEVLLAAPSNRKKAHFMCLFLFAKTYMRIIVLMISAISFFAALTFMWAYRSVVFISECLSHSFIFSSGTPFASNIVAQLCLKS